jgi:hypothetical protein
MRIWGKTVPSNGELMRKDILEHLRHHLDLAKKIFPSSYACVAGGALRDLDHGKPIKDVDIFLCCKTGPHWRTRHKLAKNKDTAPYSYLTDIKKIYGTAKSMGSKYGTVWKNHIELLNVVHIDHKPYPLQYILYSNIEGRPGPSNLLNSFDINLCKIAYDGKKIIRTDEYKADRDNKTLTHNARSISSELEKRLAHLREKYPDFTINGSTIPDQRPRDIDWQDIDISELLEDLQTPVDNTW